MQKVINNITTEMMEHVCDNLCRYPKECNEDDLVELCSECKMGEFVCGLLNTVNSSMTEKDRKKLRKLLGVFLETEGMEGIYMLDTWVKYENED